MIKTSGLRCTERSLMQCILEDQAHGISVSEELTGKPKAWSLILVCRADLVMPIVFIMIFNFMQIYLSKFTLSEKIGIVSKGFFSRTSRMETQKQRTGKTEIDHLDQ